MKTLLRTLTACGLLLLGRFIGVPHLFAQTCDPVPPGLVSWYPFEGNAGDRTGLNPGSVVGSGGQFVAAEVGQGFKSGGAGSLVLVQDSPSLALSQFSIAAWVRVDTIDSVQAMPIVWKGNSSGTDLTTPYSLAVEGQVPFAFTCPPNCNHPITGSPAPGKLVVFLTNGNLSGGGVDQIVVSNTVLSIGTFTHVAVTTDGANVSLYINGVLDTQTTQVTSMFASTYPLQIGGISGGTSNFDGVIDELQIWSRALTASEIHGIYNAGTAGLCPPPGWSPGDVFVAVGNGQYQVYHNTGTATSPSYVLVETLTDRLASGFTSGCAFDSSSNLFTTNFSNTKVFKFDANTPHSVIQTIDTNAQDPDGLSESVVIDSSGNLYVGDADGGKRLLKYDSTGAFATSFAPTPEHAGTDWVELSADQKTVFYTSEGTHVKRFDVSIPMQLGDFNSTVLPGSKAFALRLLSPFDGTGGLLVADGDRIVRLSGSGADIQEYFVTPSQICPTPSPAACPSENTWFGLNLDPNGTSFWAGAFGTANFYRFNISTGAIEVGPINTGTGLNTLFGICLKGEPAAVNTQVAALSFPAGTDTTAAATFNSGDSQNSHSWKAKLNVNTSFNITLTAHEVACDTGVACGGDDFDGVNNYRCRWEEYFSKDPQLPIGIPYSHGNCVYYRVENPPPDSDIGSDILFTIGYNDPPGTPAGTPYCSTLTGASGQPLVTRFFRDPSSPPPADAALNHSFAFDITQGSLNEGGSVGDPTLHGDTTKTFNDYAVACRDTTGATVTWLRPSGGSTSSAGSGITLHLRVTSPGGSPIIDAATSPNSMPLLITGPGGVSQTLGTAPGFWAYDSSDNWYIATWKSLKAPTGNYTLCINSVAFDYSPFPSTCTTLTLR